MSERDALPVLWHVRARTTELDELMRAPGSGIRRMHLLPLVLVPAENPRALDPPAGSQVSPCARAIDLDVASAIDRFLFECDAFRATAPGGNDWVATPAFPHRATEGEEITVDSADLPLVARGYSACLSVCAQLPADVKLEETSPIAVATFEASKRMPVVSGSGSITQLPWVIPVETAGGESRGGRDASAVARTAALTGFITAFLLQVQAAMESEHTGARRGVPLLLMGRVDSDPIEGDVAQRRPFSMMPFGFGIDEDACRRAARAARGHRFTLTVGPSVPLVTELLSRVAGDVTFARIARTLEALTCRDALGIAGYELPDDAVFDGTMADSDTLASLYEVATDTRLRYEIDSVRRRLSATVRPPRAG